MKKLFGVFVASLFCICVHAQDQPFRHELRGVIRDQNAAVVPGLRLQINPDHSTLTDINGEFREFLPEGDFVITTDSLGPEKFRAFVKITKSGVNPGFLDFVVDSSAISCGKNESGGALPRIITSAQPAYPPAARAVRAIGGVAVTVNIASDGSVSSAKAIRGHPLLRATSMLAAQKFRFESNENSVREFTLVFVFLPYENEKVGLTRYGCPYRIIVVMEEPVIEN